MYNISNKNQLKLFDPWAHLSPKRRKILDQSWAGLFQKEILNSLPVEKLARYFDKSFGRPTKELHHTIGALVLQQAFDLTDLETVDQYAFNIQWHYALDITEESDETKYMCPKTLWNMRNIVAENNLEGIIFENVTSKLAEAFKVNTTNQRMDSIHIKSNMRRLGRIGIFSETIHKFLVNLKRGNQEQFDSIDQTLVEKYLTEKALGCFSRVKPSDSRKTLDEVSKDLFELIQFFKDNEEIKNMYTYKQMERVLNEQCNLTGSDDKPVEVKTPKEIPSDSLQNPSDPDATYSGHKGQGFQVQIMETYSKQEEEKGLNLITYVEVEPAHESDANALIPAIESVKERNLQPEEVLVDTLYGSDENCEKAKELSVEVIAPLSGTKKGEGISLSEFKSDEEGKILSCPFDNTPTNIKINDSRISASFEKALCLVCPHLSRCPVREGKKFYYLNFSNKELRIAKRRAFEETEEFKDRYRWRAGVEGTMSSYDRRIGVKRLRVRGMKAVRFSAVLKALALNIFRATAIRVIENGGDQDDSSFFSGLFQLFFYVKEQFLILNQFCKNIFCLDANFF